MGSLKEIIGRWDKWEEKLCHKCLPPPWELLKTPINMLKMKIKWISPLMLGREACKALKLGHFRLFESAIPSWFELSNGW